MSKITEKNELPEVHNPYELGKQSISDFGVMLRPVIPVPHRKLDDEIVTVQGKERPVSQLYNDYVLGRLDPRQLGGGSYDEEDSDEVDPFNRSGITFEEATAIADAGRDAAHQAKAKSKDVANASTEAKQEEQAKEAKSGATNEE